MTRHVPVPPAPRVRSVLAKLSFQWESFRVVSKEVLPLWRLHWEEIALDRDTVPLDPDWDVYYDMELRGILHVLTARSRSGRLAGYVFNQIGTHSHYLSTRFAHTEMFWLHPHFRRGWLPVRMMLENLAGLRAREATVATINFKLHFQDARVGKLLARLGYEPTDIVMRRKL